MTATPTKIDKIIIDELRAMAEIVAESADTDAIDDPSAIDAAYLRSAADKFEAGSLDLTPNERQSVECELDNWLSKDWANPKEHYPRTKEWGTAMNARRQILATLRAIAV